MAIRATREGAEMSQACFARKLSALNPTNVFVTHYLATGYNNIQSDLHALYCA